MSEEINEDNCVLSEEQLKILDNVLKKAAEIANDKMLAKKYLDSTFLQIKKLNEIAKERQK